MVSKEYVDGLIWGWVKAGIIISVLISFILLLIAFSVVNPVTSNNAEWKCSPDGWKEVSREKMFSETEPTGKDIENVECERYVNSCDYMISDYGVPYPICSNGCILYSYEKVQKKCVEKVLVKREAG